MNEQIQQRLRITFAKRGTLRFIGHLDLAKTWERVIRRAGMPLVYSQGFNPQPKMQLASALPLGVSSLCELLDIWVSVPYDPALLPALLNAVSPQGLVTLSAQEVPLNGPALQTVVYSADYQAIVTEIDAVLLVQRVVALLAQSKIERARRNKTYDLRPLIYALDSDEDGTLKMCLAQGAAGTARPDEVLLALGLSPEIAQIQRTAIHLRD